MPKDDKLLSGDIDALRERFKEHSRKAHAYYAVMHSVREIVGSEDAASAWMEKGLPTFDGKSPSMLVGEDREQELLVYIGSLKNQSGD